MPVLALAVLMALVPHPVAPAAPDPPQARPVVMGSPGGEAPSTARRQALDVLHRWDAARARAFATGDPRALRVLYVPGATAADADVAVVAAYARRGLHIEGLTTQVLRVDVVAAGPGRLRLRLVDRVLSGTIVGRFDSARLAWPLPREQPRRHTVDLLRWHGSWRVATVASR